MCITLQSAENIDCKFKISVLILRPGEDHTLEFKESVSDL
jgi:hypothetical protein